MPAAEARKAEDASDDTCLIIIIISIIIVVVVIRPIKRSLDIFANSLSLCRAVEVEQNQSLVVYTLNKCTNYCLCTCVNGGTNRVTRRD